MGSEAPKKRIVDGQYIYDAPWICALCGRRYRRRHLLMIWDTVWRGRGKFARMTTLKLCADESETKEKGEIRGCLEMGLARIFAKVRRRRA